MKLNKVIFHSILIATLIVMAVALLITLAVLNVYFTSVEKSQLRAQISLIGEGVESGGLSYLESVEDVYRITWISSDGTVLFDNNVDASLMDNHLSRSEIKEALAFGFGESERYSDTIAEKTVYEARRLNDGSVIRASFTIYSVFRMTMGLVPYLLLVIIGALILSAFISRRLSSHIIHPLNSLDLDHPLENDSYEELSPLLVKIDNQNQLINKQLEELKHKEQEFTAITGNMNEGLILLNESGNIVSINSAALTILSTSNECIGHNLLTVERSLEVQKLLESAKANGRSEISISRSGRVYQFIASRIEEGTVTVGMCLLIVDETDKAHAEAIRREFSANVSHELKTPLHSILASAELLENNLVKKEDIPQFIARIRHEAEHLVTLIEDIIRLSQLDETTDFPREKVDMKELITSVTSSLEAEAKAKGVTINIKCEELTVTGVRRLLYEIIYNLVDNAVRYNKEGGSVEVSFTKEKDKLLLSVKDTGIGIAKEHFNRIFERFYRVDKSHSRETGGTGLGLSIVKHAALIHKGEVSVNSSVGEGTEMCVSFPLSMLD